MSAIECLAGYHYKDLKFPFDSVEKFRGVRPVLDDHKLPSASALVNEVKEKLNGSEHFLFQKFKAFITDHLSEEFWDGHQMTCIRMIPYFRQLSGEDLAWCLRRVYDARSGYLHVYGMYPRYINLVSASAPIR